MGLEEVAAIMAVEEETATDMRRDTQEQELVAGEGKDKALLPARQARPQGLVDGVPERVNERGCECAWVCKRVRV